jgi:hypothetical protein
MVIFVGLLCWGLLYFLNYSYCRNSTAQELFFPAGTLIAVKLLIASHQIDVSCTPIVIRATQAFFQLFDDEIFPQNQG